MLQSDWLPFLLPILLLKMSGGSGFANCSMKQNREPVFYLRFEPLIDLFLKIR